MPKIRWNELEEVRERELVPVPVRRQERQKERALPIEKLPAWVPLWTPAREVPRRWRVK